jgi:hypothetical protein
LILDFDGGMISLLGSVGLAIAQVEAVVRETGRRGPV